MKRTIAALIAAALMLAAAAQAKADPIEDFYRGKTLRMLIGYGPGGGYDLYGRLAAEFLPRFIPGNPLIVPQNMPGGGSFVAAKFMYEAAPKDGTVFGSLAQTLALDSMVNTSAKIDVRQFHYLGRLVTNIDTGVALPKSGIRSFEDLYESTSHGGTVLVLSDLRAQPREALGQAGLLDRIGRENILPDIDSALAHAAAILVEHPVDRTLPPWHA